MFNKFLSDRLQAIVEDKVYSFIGWEIIMLFNDNPNLKIKKPQLARTINRSEEDVIPTLKHFTDRRIVSVEDDFIMFSPSEDVKEELDLFIEALEDRNQRLAIISQLLDK